MNWAKVVVVVILAGLITLNGCKKDNDATPSCTKEVEASKLTTPDQTKLTSDSLLIVQYLADNGITGTEILNKVRYKIHELGTGETPCLQNTIKLHYKGRLMKTGYVFDPDQETQPDVNWQEREASFTLSSLIVGWQVVLPSIPAGTKLTLYIPSGYGYGTGVGGGGAIPVNANLIFDIEFLEIVK
ncbi:MAG: FKBP-type peptidyl-prolyl cis-trans isomerase [Cytophagales bacterium]|nr:FKBP-type peptidyl-prolyl cis-trans isomerase [Cytophagales bacterium]